MSSHTNISNTHFNQRSPRPLEEGVLNCHTHTDRRTLWLYDWIGLVGRLGENIEVSNEKKEDKNLKLDLESDIATVRGTVLNLASFRWCGEYLRPSRGQDWVASLTLEVMMISSTWWHHPDPDPDTCTLVTSSWPWSWYMYFGPDSIPGNFILILILIHVLWSWFYPPSSWFWSWYKYFGDIIQILILMPWSWS